MWEAIVVVVTLLGGAVLGGVATIVFDEVSEIPEKLRMAIRGPATCSPSARVARLEERLVTLERKVSRAAA
jgi:hypothetical protein